MLSVQGMHHIQKAIIQQLAQTSPLRFSQLQPRNVPNNTFSYHLKKLLESNYILTTEQGYIATRKALKTFQHSEDSHIKKATAPSLISIIYVTNPSGETLLLKRHRRPFVNWYGVPSGLIHQGETLQVAAKRELFEKTGIREASDLAYVGVLDFTYRQPDSHDLFVHAVALIYHYQLSLEQSASITPRLAFGELRWSNLDHDDILPEVYTIDSLAQADHYTMSSVEFDEPTVE